MNSKTLLLLLFSIFSLCAVADAATFYSQNTGNFSTLSNWNTDPGGAGSNPIAADLTDGTNIFIVQDGHVITLDQDIDVSGITIGQGVSGTLTIGNDATARDLVIQGPFTVSNGAAFTIGAFSATHTIDFQGAITNNGTFDLYNASNQVANSTFNGTFSVGGANTPQFSNVNFSSGTVTAGVAIDVEGSLTIENATTFADGNFTHTVAQNWTENGSGQMTGSGTIQMDATIVQSIATAATFNDLTFNGGGIVTIAGNITVNGNLLATNGTSVSTSTANIFQGNFTVNNASIFNATNGTTTFNGSGTQTIDIINTTFDQLDFDNGGAANPKNITGNLTANDRTRIFNDAEVNDAAGGQTHTFEEFRVDGVVNFTGDLIFTGGNIYDNTDNAISLGTANISTQGGTVTLSANDVVTVGGDLTVETGTFTINQNASLTASGGTLLVRTGNTIRMLGADNFPTGFGTVTFESTTSRAMYNLNGVQTIRGGVTYGELEIGGGDNKTVDGSLDIEGNLDLNNSISLFLLGFDHTLAGSIFNNSNSSITAIGGTFTMDAPDANQTIQTPGSGFYILSNLIFDNNAATATRTKAIQGNILLTGNFTASNAAQTCIVDIDANNLLNDGGDTFTLEANVQLRTSGTNGFSITTSSFGTIALDVASTVYFDGNAQFIPGGFTYGNVLITNTANKTALANIDVDGFFSRVSGGVVFVDGGFDHTVAGAWNMGLANTSMTGSMTFDGINQSITASNFNDVTFANSGIKTLTGDIDVASNLTINDGVTVNATIRDINIAGDWSNPGTGTFNQTTGFTVFDGTVDQNITSNANGAFGDLDINKSSGTVFAQSDINVDRDFELIQNNADFDLNGQTAFIGRDFINRTGTTFTANGGTLHFNANIQQDIFNFNGTTVYGNLEFSGAGEKNLSQNGMDINGNVIISGSAFNAGGLPLSVTGDWTNTGSFQHTNSLTLDGVNQAISSSTFHDVIASGSGTKTLGGNITLDGRFEIQDGVTFDVSASNFDITVEEAWTNSGTGVFVEQNGTVSFTGANSTITTGAVGPTIGKRFYDIVISSAGTETLGGDLDVENDLTITTGTLRTQAFDLFISGNFTNNGGFNHNNNASLLTFDGTSGSHTIDMGVSQLRDMTIDGLGATYTMASDITFIVTTGRAFTINAGTFSTGSNDIFHLSTNALIQLNANGIFNVEAGAVVTLGRTASLINSGGALNIIGTAVSPATITSNQTITSRYITITQTSGSIDASFASFEKTLGNGVDIQGGTIDAVNNFSDCTFSNGAGTSYLTLTGLNFGAGITITNSIFNSGPTFNVSRTSGTGAVTFQDATGTLAGESFDNDDADPGTLIVWTFPGGFFFDNDAGNNDWHTALNWSGNTVPDNTSNVILEHTTGGIAAAYAVNITSSNADAGRLTLDAEGGNTITLVLNGQELTVDGNVQIGASTTVTQTNSTDFFNVSGSWINEGTLNEGTSAVRFVGTGGVNPIITGGASDPFYDLQFNGAGATYIIQSTLDVDNDFTLDDGIVQFGTQTVTIGGNWTLNGGTFDAGTSLVTFDKGGTSTQTINSGTFNDFEVSNSTGSGTATKQLTGGVTVEDDLRIRANSVLDGGTNFLFVRDNWRNDVGNSGFTQTGIGAVLFDGAGQVIGNGGTETTFNSIFLQGTGDKVFNQNATINTDISIASGLGNVILSNGITITGSGGSNTLSMSGSTLSVRGDSPTNFPTGFETINLSGGVVEYRSDANQDIFPTTYFDLRLRNNTATSVQTKTVTADFAITDDLLINDVDTELDVAGFTITLSDNITFPAGGTQINWNGGTLFHNGTATWNIDTDITGFNNMVLSGSGVKVMLNNLSITGDVTVQSGIRLDMNANPMTSTGTGTFTLTSGARLDSDIPSITGPAFPTNFAAYNLDVSSEVRLRTNNDKTIYTNGGTLTYGILDMAYIGTATPDGNLDVDGNFLAQNNDLFLQDGGFDINLSGGTIDMRNYTATTNTFTFDGADQTIQFLNGATNPDVITFDNVVFTGSGAKPFTSGDDLMIINGDFTIDVGISMTSNIDFQSRGNWTNNGTFSQIGGILTFDGTGVQTIDPGADNTIDLMVFSNGGANAKTVVNNGFDINGNFTIDAGATADFGSLTHTIASATITNNGTWVTSAANLTFDRTGGQSIPGFTALDVLCTGSGTKTMQGNWITDDLTIDPTVTLDANNGNDYSITLTGNWSNSGTFNRRLGTVAFESNDTNAKTILSNNSDFYNVTFNQAQTNSRTYTLLDNTDIDEDLTIGNGAVLDVNSFDLTLGDNDAGNPGGETHTIQTGGELIIDSNATLNFECSDGDASLTVAGTFTVVGSSGNIANVTRSAGGNRIDIDITTGTIAARFYHFRFLVNNGLDVQSTATVDATNNFSDGSWSDINTGGGASKRYLIFEADATGLPDINNVSFNHGTSPQIGVHFNVQRSALAIGAITFAGTISGLMGSELYEDDPAGTQINWPPSSVVTWVGTINSDWHTAGNWSPTTVPTNLIEAVIPSASNNPIINLADASAQQLTITDGILTVDAGFDLTVTTDIIIGTGASIAVLAVGNTTSEITIGGGWSLGTNAVFSNGASSVTFNAATGTPSILPRTSPFNNLNFNGTATFGISGDADVDGNIIISNGIVQPTTGGYTLSVAGDINNIGGSFNNSTAGTLVLDGSDQDITNITLNAVTVDGTGTKTMNSTVTIAGNLAVNSTIAGAAGSLIEMDADVTINPGGTFNDGGETHTFSGDDWTGNGSYAGTGTINFDRAGAQDINGGQFNSIDFIGTGQINILGDVDVTGDVTARNTIGTLRCNTFLIDNISGTGTFTLESFETIYVLGTNNFPANFATYNIDPTSSTRYQGTIDQTIAGVSYGSLLLFNTTTKTLGGNIDVNGTVLDVNTSTLDVSASDFTINLAGALDLNDGGSFNAQNGEVILDGTANQTISLGLAGTSDFNRLTINNSGGTVTINTNDLMVSDNLRVFDGIFNLNGFNGTIGGDLTASGGGTFSNSGTYILNKVGGSANVQMNGSTINNLVINAPGATYTALDDATLNGNFTLTTGTFDGNGQTIILGNGADVTNISGTYIVGSGGSMALGNGASLVVNSGGTLVVVGSGASVASVTRRDAGRYNFTIDGTIQATNYLFEWMDDNGIFVSSTGTIDGTDNFSDGTFTNGEAGKTLLRIENTQDFTGASAINNVTFPINPGGGAFNVTKTVGVSGTLEFFNATGNFAGESFDNDPNNLINWTGPVTLVWNGSSSSDWYTAANWTPSQVPTSADNAQIVAAGSAPVITSAGAQVNNLEIASGALTINTADAGVDLDVFGDFTINSVFSMVSGNDRIEVDGNWTRGGSGTFSPGTGVVGMTNPSGLVTLNNGTSQFYDLEINGAGAVQIASNTDVNNDFSIISGSFDITTSNFTLTVGNDFTNAGTFIARSGKVTMDAPGAGIRVIDIGTSSLFNLDINGGASTVFEITTNDLSVTNDIEVLAGTLDFNSRTVDLGGQLSVAGTVEVDANAVLDMGSGSSVSVNSGGVFSAVGTNISNIATITGTAAGPYSFIVNSGGEIEAQFYLFEFMNTSGLQIASGALIDATNNFSNGIFSNGAAGGRYLLLQNNFADYAATAVTFNNGPAVNVRRVSGTGIITFEDALGILAGAGFEDDSPDGSATTGFIRWSFTSPVLTWTGTSDSNWHNLLNWDDGGGGNGVPSANTNTFIPNVGTDPIISTADADAGVLTIFAGGNLTINSNFDLTVAGDISNAGTLTVGAGSTTTITSGGSWTNTGTFTNGGSSTVVLNATSGTQTITTGGSAFCGLEINSGAPGTAIFQSQDAIDVDCNFTIIDGSLDITNISHTMTVAGNWDVNAAGTYTNGGSSVTFDGAAQSITMSSGDNFEDVVITGSSIKTLASSISVNDITINSTLAGGANGITVTGNWTNPGTFNFGTSTVSFTGANQQILTNATGEDFFGLTINNSSVTFPQIVITGPIMVNNGGTLTLTDGIIETSSSNMFTMDDNTTLAGGTTDDSFISGPITKIGQQNFTFPVGKGSVFARIGISGLLATGTFVAEYFDAFYGDATSEPALVRISGVEYWDLDRSAGTGDPFVTLFWEDGTRSGVGNLTNLRVAHFFGALWTDQGNNGAPTGSPAAGSVTSAVRINSFSPFTLGSSDLSNPLPVELVEFTGRMVDGSSKLQWKTASEIDNDFFEVQVSTDGEQFSVVGIVEGAGNSNELLTYRFTHEEPFIGSNYYRLRQVDFNGDSEYSEVIRLDNEFNQKNIELELTPNPTTYNNIGLRIKPMDIDSRVKITLIDSFGRIVLENTIDEDTDFSKLLTLKTRVLSSGLYFVIVEQASYINKKKLLIE